MKMKKSNNSNTDKIIRTTKATKMTKAKTTTTTTMKENGMKMAWAKRKGNEEIANKFAQALSLTHIGNMFFHTSI